MRGFFLLSVGFFLLFSGEGIIRGKAEALDLLRPGSRESELSRLREKNAELEAELVNLKIRNPEEPKNYKEAKVYSSYPFFDKAEITINIGRESGAREGAPVLAGQRILIGRIKTVYKRLSVVQTIFDPAFKIPARIGLEEVDALYLGGLAPRLSLVEDLSAVEVGEVVVSADKNFPYGLVLGRIMDVSKKNDLSEVRIKPIYEFKNLRNVLVFVD